MTTGRASSSLAQSTKQQSIHHYKTLQLLDFTEIRAFLFPIRHYKTPFNLRILGVDLVNIHSKVEKSITKTTPLLINLDSITLSFILSDGQEIYLLSQTIPNYTI